MDFKSLLLLILDQGQIESVIEAHRIFQYTSEEERIIANCMVSLIQSDVEREDYLKMHRQLCEDYGIGFDKCHSFAPLIESIIADYLMISPDISEGRVTEKTLHKIANDIYTCDVCENEISPGDDMYFRGQPHKAIRHAKCNKRVKSKYEYAYIEYILEDLYSFERLFTNRETIDYDMATCPGTRSAFKKAGFVVNIDEKVLRIPNFGQFVLDYISGKDDYCLIKEYRPYHVYIDFLLKIKGVSEYEHMKIGGYKYFLRTPLGRI